MKHSLNGCWCYSRQLELCGCCFFWLLEVSFFWLRWWIRFCKQPSDCNSSPHLLCCDLRLLISESLPLQHASEEDCMFAAPVQQKTTEKYFTIIALPPSTLPPFFPPPPLLPSPNFAEALHDTFLSRGPMHVIWVTTVAVDHSTTVSVYMSVSGGRGLGIKHQVTYSWVREGGGGVAQKWELWGGGGGGCGRGLRADWCSTTICIVGRSSGWKRVGAGPGLAAELDFFSFLLLVGFC